MKSYGCSLLIKNKSSLLTTVFTDLFSNIYANVNSSLTVKREFVVGISSLPRFVLSNGGFDVSVTTKE